MALELLTDIIPSVGGNLNYGMRHVPHVMAKFAVVSRTAAADFLRGLVDGRMNTRFGHFISGNRVSMTAEHPSTLTSMYNLANVLSDQRQYEQAEEMLVVLSQTVILVRSVRRLAYNKQVSNELGLTIPASSTTLIRMYST